MGCFSFLCKNSGKAAMSSSFGDSPCRMFLLKDGEVIEEMHGNYDSYGRVFNGKGGSFEWQMDWSGVCDLILSSQQSNGIALILDEYWDGVIPKTKSEDDPNQGCGDGDDEEDLFVSTEDNLYHKVENPYHKVYKVMGKQKKEDDDLLVIEDTQYTVEEWLSRDFSESKIVEQLVATKDNYLISLRGYLSLTKESSVYDIKHQLAEHPVAIIKAIDFYLGNHKE